MTDVRSPGARSTGARSDVATFARSLGTQRRVIAALLLRELHTRFGRDNIGYMWVFGEPMFLAIAIGILHASAHVSFGQTINPVALAVLGYSTFMLYRATVTRAEGMLEANMPLLYHRTVTILDMLVARGFLEFCACTFTTLVLMGACMQLGYASLPARPLQFIFGLFLLTWFSFNLSMVISAGTYDRHTLARFVHPVMYISMPLSATFFTLSSIPDGARSAIMWWPLALIFEQIRYGWFDTASDRYLHTGYVLSANALLTYVGLVMIRRVRRKVHLH